MAKLSPMMEQYFQIKQNYPDTLLFFRLGDFYEMFFDDAKTASKELELVLTGRDCGQEERAPMCGVPFHSADGYIARLVSKGYKVAICEQLEDPALAKGIVERDVIRIITPGTVIESNMLPEDRNNYLAAVYFGEATGAVCFADISTGEVHIDDFTTDSHNEKLLNLLGCFSPSEVLFNESAALDRSLSAFVSKRLKVNTEVLDETYFEPNKCREIVLGHLKAANCKQEDILRSPEIVAAFGAALLYLAETQKTDIENIGSVERYDENGYMSLDLTARRNLEITETNVRREKRGSLLWVIDHTKTAMGKRLIRSWAEQPLVSCTQILFRQNAVAELCADTVLTGEEMRLLGEIYDLERIMTRILYESANAKELRALSFTIQRLGEIKSRLSGVKSKALCEIHDDIDLLEDVNSLVTRSIVENPPFSVREGGMIARGYNTELDELHEIVDNGKGFIAGIEESEQEKTGIKKLKIGYNRVFGYYIEVSNSFKDQVPETYIRKQTLSNCERYITSELKELESKVLGAQERIVKLEYELFCDVRRTVAAEIERVRRTARAVARLDVLASFAYTANLNNYCCPQVNNGDEIVIKDGRHPVVELMLDGAPFVPNDTLLNCREDRCAIITGPNMAGKSTYMRQVALITLMAQIGSFVPARSAVIGIVDKIFTRVGASDDLAAGQSTFMMEMTEVASILENATRKSLVIFDEIGRGTSTFDGMSIARAVLEYTADKKKIGAKTLFATHYHELTELEGEVEGVRNYSIAVKKRGDDITFLRRIIKGAADGSYGIEVAKLAGVPDAVVSKAKAVLKKLEADGVRLSVKSIDASDDVEPEDELQMSFASGAQQSIVDTLKALDVNTLTPIEALSVLYELSKKANGQ
ncbi:MAG: DNA mismatch repair protein MutS [Clostridiales bacterium]|nr:DNA mismatch repair protein MutS [Clostridiales bacterium]